MKNVVEGGCHSRNFDDLRSFLSSSTSLKALLEGLEIREGWTASDIVGWLYEEVQSSTIDGLYQRRCTKCLNALVKKYHVFPTSFFCDNVRRDGDYPLGGGGFADVYRGVSGNRPVCLKVLRVHTQADEKKRKKMVEDFCQEALIWTQLSHPNVLQLIGVNTNLFKTDFCLVSPWMVNKDIIIFLKMRPEHNRLRSIREIAAGLEYLHSRSPTVVHGDIRGANILVDEDSRCRLADFGLSREASGTTTMIESSSGDMKGSLRWMAPEMFQMRGKSSTEDRCSRDIYAYACTIVEIMTGRPPFPDLHDVAVITQVLFNHARPERPSGVWCPDNVWELVQKCWDQDRLERPTATYIHNYLAGLIEMDPSLNDDDSDEPRYRGWLSEVLKPLEEFIDEPIDPREYYHDLEAIGEGESGMVFVARVTETGNIHRLKLAPLVKARDAYNQVHGVKTLVAIKSVEIVPSGMTKIEDLRNELKLLEGVSTHPNILRMDALYVDLVEDSLWIRMELMEMSLADVVELVGVNKLEVSAPLQQSVVARFAGDILDAIQFLHSHRIAHRDLRSDNLLLNSEGVLKLSSFEYAIKLPVESSLAVEPVGILYWQAPEMRTGDPYDALKVDVWSLGATVWEVAQSRPPFADEGDSTSKMDQLPPLDKPHLYSVELEEFLQLCSKSPSERPSPNELLKNLFISASYGRSEVQKLIRQCLLLIGQGKEDEDL